MLFGFNEQHGIRKQKNCCLSACRNKENVRFIMTSLFFVFYLIVGATAFQWLQSEEQKSSTRESFYSALKSYWNKCNGTLDEENFRSLLHSYGYLFTEADIPNDQHTSFIESLDFVTTAITTIGFGNITPQSILGKIFFIVYALLGCPASLLLLNSSLERMITFLAAVLRYVHKSRMYLSKTSTSEKRRFSKEWKPPLQHVLICLLLLTTAMTAVDSFIFSIMEGWSYVDSVYFCFVAFSTIGFGDYVPGRNSLNSVAWYRIANLFLIISGNCCFYSLFCVSSIALKNFLNRTMDKVFHNKPNIQQERKFSPSRRFSKIFKQVFSASFRHKKHFVFSESHYQNSVPPWNSSASEESRCRRNSDELPELRELLRSNHLSLVMMQKELHDLAQMKRDSQELQSCGAQFGTTTVGSVAILATKIELT